ncbi:MAG: type II toxin-antitoxin system RelE/ParE family toxin [Planctomycetota bacterium]
MKLAGPFPSVKRVAYAITKNGRLLAQEFMEELDDREASKALALFNLMDEAGVIKNKQKFNHIEDKIYEFKPTKQIRFGCFLWENCWLLTHGFKKKQRAWPFNQIIRAQKIRTECLEMLK